VGAPGLSDLGLCKFDINPEVIPVPPPLVTGDYLKPKRGGRYEWKSKPLKKTILPSNQIDLNGGI
jgi:hypothetical protein